LLPRRSDLLTRFRMFPILLGFLSLPGSSACKHSGLFRGRITVRKCVWLVRTSKDLGGRPLLQVVVFSLSWLFFHGDAIYEKDQSKIRTCRLRLRCVFFVSLQLDVVRFRQLFQRFMKPSMRVF